MAPRLRVLALLLVAGCSAAPASPEEAFVRELHRSDYPAIDASVVRSEAVRTGYAICDLLAVDGTEWEAIDAMTKAGLTNREATAMLTAAQEHLCTSRPA